MASLPNVLTLHDLQQRHEQLLQQHDQIASNLLLTQGALGMVEELIATLSATSQEVKDDSPTETHS